MLGSSTVTRLFVDLKRRVFYVAQFVVRASELLIPKTQFFYSLLNKVFFYFPEEEWRRRRRQINYIAEDALKLSDYNYGCRWERDFVPFYSSYETG